MPGHAIDDASGDVDETLVKTARTLLLKPEPALCQALWPNLPRSPMPCPRPSLSAPGRRGWSIWPDRQNSTTLE